MIRNTTITSSVVMGLIAQMAYAVSLSPPGGYWQDTTSSHKADKAVVTSTHSGLYKVFVRSNNKAYVSALLVIFLINIILPQTSIIYTLAVLLATIVALGGVSLGYGTAMIITNPVQIQPVRQVITTVGAAFAGMLLLVISMAVLKNAYTKWKEQNPQMKIVRSLIESSACFIGFNVSSTLSATPCSRLKLSVSYQTFYQTFPKFQLFPKAERSIIRHFIRLIDYLSFLIFLSSICLLLPPFPIRSLISWRHGF